MLGLPKKNILLYILLILMLQLPVGKQRHSILHSDARINIWEGSVRSGKTIASILRWIQYCIEAPPGNLLMCGKTQRSLERNVLDIIAELVGPKNFVYKRVQGECYIYGRRCFIVGASDEKATDKIQGLTLAGAYSDEAPLYPETFFTMLLSRLSIKGAKLFLTANPSSGNHWLKKKYIDRINELNLKVFHFTLEDNQSLDPEYVENLKKEYIGLWYSRYILGLWVNAQGAVYQNFDYNKNVVDTLPEKFDQLYVSCDYGTASPFCALLLGRSQNKWYCIREMYYDSQKTGRQKTDKEYAEDLVKFLDGKYPQKILVDPSASSYIIQLKTLKKYRVGYAQNDVLTGIRLVAKAFSDGNLLIHKNCVKLIEQLGAYSWDERAQMQGLDKPNKIDDHAPDSLRYCCLEIFKKNYNKMLVDLPK